MNIPVTAYNPSQKERFKKRLLLFYSVHDPEGSGRVNNALSLKIPEAMVMSSLYSKYNVNFEDEEKAARQKGLLPEQQQHFNAEFNNNNDDNYSDNGTTNSGHSPASLRGRSGTTASGVFSMNNNNNNINRHGSMISQSNLQHMRSHAASMASGVFMPPSAADQFDGINVQQSFGNFSASPSMAFPGGNPTNNANSDQQQHNHSSFGENNFSIGTASADTSPSSQVVPPPRRGHSSSSVGFPSNLTNTNNSNSSNNNIQHQQQSSESLPVASLPETERQRVQKRVDRFYKKFFPEGAWKAQEARSSPMTENDLFESLCTSYKVSQAEEKALAAEFLPENQQGQAVDSVRSFYEEKLKKMEIEHKKQLQQEHAMKRQLEEEKEKLKKDREQEISRIKIEQDRLASELKDYQHKLQTAKETIEAREKELDELMFAEQKEAEMLGGRRKSTDSSSSSAMRNPAVEAQLAHLKSELDAAKKYAETLENVHKAEMEEKETELLQRLQEKAALERKLSEDNQVSPPSRRDLLYEQQKQQDLRKQVEEDEDLPPTSAPPPNYSPASPMVVKEPTVSEQRHRQRIERAILHSSSSPASNLGGSSPNRFSSFTGEGSPLRRFFSHSQQNNKNGISTPASPVRIRGHASPEHPLLMICGICGEQGRDRFCHNCGANYHQGENYCPE